MSARANTKNPKTTNYKNGYGFEIEFLKVHTSQVTRKIPISTITVATWGGTLTDRLLWLPKDKQLRRSFNQSAFYATEKADFICIDDNLISEKQIYHCITRKKQIKVQHSKHVLLIIPDKSWRMRMLTLAIFPTLSHWTNEITFYWSIRP